MKEKGIEDAVNAVKAVNESFGRTVYALDIYGPIDSEQSEWFADLRKSFPEYVKYCGIVPFDKSVDVLKNYLALLFPTHYYTEGIPGTIIDAYAAGVPVISAKWESFEDVVDDGITGVGYEFDNQNRLISAITYMANDPTRVYRMKTHCTRKAEDFIPKTVLRHFVSFFD